jgi:hypothetical protein
MHESNHPPNTENDLGLEGFQHLKGNSPSFCCPVVSNASSVMRLSNHEAVRGNMKQHPTQPSIRKGDMVWGKEGNLHYCW